MPTKLIKLDDGILVEVDAPEDEMQQIIDGRLAKKVDTKLEDIGDILLKTCRSINHVWKKIDKEIEMEQAEVELGLCFEGEGNIYVARSRMLANLQVKLIIKPKR